jgi:hypothetical protein
VFVLGEVAVEVVCIMRRGGRGVVDKSFGGVARVGDAGQAVGPGRVVVIIGQVVDGSKSKAQWSGPGGHRFSGCR